MDIPKTRWAKTIDGAYIAYQDFGDGPITLIVIHGWVSHLEVDWEQPRYARFMRRLASNMRILNFDKRGTGMSDRFAQPPDLEVRMDDVRAVMDAAGVERAALLGWGTGGPPLAVFFAATHPERTIALCIDPAVYEDWLSVGMDTEERERRLAEMMATLRGLRAPAASERQRRRQVIDQAQVLLCERHREEHGCLVRPDELLVPVADYRRRDGTVLEHVVGDRGVDSGPLGQDERLRKRLAKRVDDRVHGELHRGPRPGRSQVIDTAPHRRRKGSTRSKASRGPPAIIVSLRWVTVAEPVHLAPTSALELRPGMVVPVEPPCSSLASDWVRA